MAAGDEVVPVEPHRILGAAPDPGRGRELDNGAHAERGALDHDELRRRRQIPRARLVGLLSGEDDALLRCRAQVLRRAARHEPHEEVEQDEEPDLQREQRLVGVDRSDHGSERPKTRSVEPIVIWSP